MKYKVVEKGFPIKIALYQKNVSLGMIEVYRTGKIYFLHSLSNNINAGMSIKDISKILKIAKKELRKEKIRHFLNVVR
jgi:hypothetical protein